MQDDLFGGLAAPPDAPAKKSAPQAPRAHTVDDLDDVLTPHETAPAPTTSKRRTGVQPAPGLDLLQPLAAKLPPGLRLGTSSWSYPGWKGLVWEGEHSAAQLSKTGLPVYAQHPLMRTVSIDRGFYRPLTASEYERYASQVPDNFRFVVKAPSLVTDALVRSDDGRGREPNPAFLNPVLAAQDFVQPALAGLGHKTGALVFQLSPLPSRVLDRMHEVLEQLRAMLLAQPPLQPSAPDGVLAVEVRDAQWLAPDVMPHFADVLRETGATYCLGLHPKLPPLQEQLKLLRLLWPGPMVCRWNLNPLHGPYGYEDAEKQYAPYDRIHHPDPEAHALLARTIAGITSWGQNAYVTISNHAEGCAPLTVCSLAEHVAALREPA